MRGLTVRALAPVLVIVALSGGTSARPAPQDTTLDRLAGLPGVETYTSMQQRLRGGPAYISGALRVTWSADSRSFTYMRDGRARRFDVRSMSESAAPMAPDAPAAPAAAPSAPPRRACPAAVIERGRQSACAASPDESLKAFTRDRNVYIARPDGSGEVQVTFDGSADARIKSGTASWVYGEELDQATAIWWSPDGRQVAFYRFDEKPVRDYYVLRDQTALQDALDVEAYPKAGTANPIADVLVYDVESKRTTTLDVRDGKPFADDVVGHYVFAMAWAPDSSELRLHRTDRLQQTLEYVGCSPASGACRVILREVWPTGWVENRPTRVDLRDGHRFVWGSDRTGWRNYYLYDYTGRLLAPLTALNADATAIVKIDEDAGLMFYMARDGETVLKPQLHRVGLDGRGDVRLTDPAFAHSVVISPDNRFFVDVYQTHDRAPSTRLVSVTTGATTEVAASDLTRFDQLGLRKVELFSYLAADGRTTLYGSIAFPSTFDPAASYPTLISVYGGPEADSDLPSEEFTVPNALTEYGFLRVRLMTRAAPGLGRQTLDSIYLKLGQTELDDLVEGVKALTARTFVDRGRIGIFGTSYGGYLAALALVRYPDVFAAAAASSPVTDWRLYDTIYTERYMGLPQANADGYERARVMRYADRLRGRLLLYYGTADNNVHPTNSLQLIQALTRARKSVEVQVGPDAEHSAVNVDRMMAFFIESLVLRPDGRRAVQP